MRRGSNAAQKMLDRAKRYGPLYGFLMLWVAICTAFATIDPSGTPLESARRETSVIAYGGIVVCAGIGLLTFFHPLLQKPSQWLRSHLLQVFGFLALALLVLSIYLSLPLASIALALGFLISGLGIGAGLPLAPGRAIRESPHMAEEPISQADLESLRDRVREVIALHHQLNLLLIRVRHGLLSQKYQTVDVLVVMPSLQRVYDELLEKYRIWELRTERLLRDYAPQYEGHLTSARKRTHHAVYLRLPYPIDQQRWFNNIKKPLREIEVLIKELGKQLTVSIGSELPYDFMEHFYDPSTEHHAANPANIRLVERAECGSVTYPAIFEHPPEEGDAILTYHLSGLPLPPAQFRLSFRCGVIDKLYDEPSGAPLGESDFRSFEGNEVVFAIKVDGKRIFHLPQYGHEWSFTFDEGPLEAPNGDLTVEFRTNAMGEPRGNWAAWGEPKLVEATPPSSAAG